MSLRTASGFGAVVLILSWVLLLLTWHTSVCPCFSVVLEAFHEERLRDLGGVSTQLESPSMVLYPEEGVAGRNEKQQSFPFDEGSLIFFTNCQKMYHCVSGETFFVPLLFFFLFTGLLLFVILRNLSFYQRLIGFPVCDQFLFCDQFRSTLSLPTISK